MSIIILSKNRWKKVFLHYLNVFNVDPVLQAAHQVGELNYELGNWLKNRLWGSTMC